jgi:hypothetical protein
MQNCAELHKTGQLLDMTSEKPWYTMFQDNCDIRDKTEEVILTSSKKLAVKVKNVMVSCITLHRLQQEADESIQNFAVQVKGQAELCDLNVACTPADCNREVCYVDPVIRDLII